MNRTFTIEHANRSLILVRTIVQDIINTCQLLAHLEENQNPDPELNQRYRQRIEHFLEELQKMGAVCRDLKRGLVDFPTYYEGEPVFLSWQAGEDHIRFWRTLNGGYDKRHEIDEHFIQFNSATADSVAPLH